MRHGRRRRDPASAPRSPRPPPAAAPRAPSRPARAGARCLLQQPRLERLEALPGTEVQQHVDRLPFELRAVPVPRRVQHHRPAGAEMRPEQRALEVDRAPIARPRWSARAMRDARERGVAIAVQKQRRQRRRRLDVAVTERARELVARAVAAGLRQRPSARGEDDGARAVRRVVAGRPEIPVLARVTAVTRSPVCSSAPASRSAPSSASSTSRALLRVGKQLAVLLLVQRDAELREERGGLAAGNARSTLRTTRDDPPQKSRSVTSRVGDVAARTAADEDLRADAASRRRRRRRAAPARDASRRSPSRDPAAPAPTTTRSAVPQPSMAQLYLADTAGLARHTRCNFIWSRTRRLPRPAIAT